MARIEIKRQVQHETTAGVLEIEGQLEIRLREEAPLAWTSVPDGADLPDGGNVVVSLGRLPEVADDPRFGALGVRIQAGEDVRKIAPFLSRIRLVELEFPKFRDGRNYSSASILRQQMKYTGEIRAVGDVLADQLFFMVRCGIDSLVLHPSVREETARRALERYPFVYQQASDGRRPIWSLRNG